ncbi:hypothetical protein BT67DRAFT_432726 [Trichocladium antarcticum]|uniref:PHD-type domain-containing protein n=1 Tax=Trichocladium antarcticum TaxID=1450529 RepID=A0AAN6UQC6_9PEZI|nr:hypothetical protein BT67DRAFT_432726 [Trichocladium antarcticum]
MPHSEKDQRAPPPDSDSDGVDQTMTGNNSKAVSAKKKKGTAAAIKAPKRPKPGAPGGAKRSKPGRPKKVRTDASSKQPGVGSSVASDDGRDGGDSESDSGPYCLCRGPDDHRFMIACDRCEDWFHGACIGMDKHTGEKLVQKYICPNCTEGGRYTTRYKKMCSLAGCKEPALIYDAARPSIFCSPAHCQAWWEQLIAALPRTKGAAAAAAADHLTQEEFMGLLDAQPFHEPAASKDDDLPISPWKLGKPPFALTAEETALLTASAATRHRLGEEIVLCRQMLQLIDLAVARREAAVAGRGGAGKDLCGYDGRLDSVGATHQFALFAASPQGEAALRAANAGVPEGDVDVDVDVDVATAGMCAKKKCKAHNGWSGILVKAVKHDMKELAAQAKEKLDAEERVRDGAAGRFRRRMKERNGVVVLGGEDAIKGDGMEVDGG